METTHFKRVDSNFLTTSYRKIRFRSGNHSAPAISFYGRRNTTYGFWRTSYEDRYEMQKKKKKEGGRKGEIIFHRDLWILLRLGNCLK